MTRCPLTAKQAKVYDFIHGFYAKHGYGPTYNEIMAEFGMTNRQVVFGYRQALHRKGWVHFSRQPRTLRPVDVSLPGDLAHACRVFVDTNPHFMSPTVRLTRAFADLREALEAVEGKGKAA